MAEITEIGWCDATINFWHGCEKVSEGCKFCYMFRDKEKYGQDGRNVVRTSQKTIDRILKDLNRQHEERKADGITEPLKIFTCSWSDFFIDKADDWRKEAWDTIRANPQFVWIVLTKRIERAEECFPPDWGAGWDHVWLMVSAENQARWNERVPILLDTRAKVRGVSAEPLIGPIDIRRWSKSKGPCPQCEGDGSIEYDGGGMQCPTCFYDERFQQGETTLDWIIVGGESGNDFGKYLYRLCEINWIRKIVNEAQGIRAAVFVKQLGTHIGKKLNLKRRSGDKMNDWPALLDDIKIQKFPVL